MNKARKGDPVFEVYIRLTDRRDFSGFRFYVAENTEKDLVVSNSKLQKGSIQIRNLFPCKHWIINIIRRN